ncbi:hypothetical protein [Coleofasciculus chthonoplastes]|uniref:hypothetical protein n=1 Tax=Coleofasciculus chthonoplastes TaxID=64178 RepID=UPI0032F24422
MQANLQANQDQKLDPEERELIMALAPLYRQQLDAALQRGMEQGLQQGIQQGIQQGQRLIIEKVTSLLALPPQQLSQYLLQLSQLSREQLLARFPIASP